MSTHTHFNSAVRFLVYCVLHGPRRGGYLTHPETVMEAYDAISYIGVYMGRSDIYKLAEPAHVILGDTPALDDITWVLAEVQKFREANATVPLHIRFMRWFEWTIKSNKK